MKVFQPFVELHVKILNLFREKEPHWFTCLISEYTLLLKELVEAASRQAVIETYGSQSFFMKPFFAQEPVKLATDCILKMENLNFRSQAECTLLQLNITKVFCCKFVSAELPCKLINSLELSRLSLWPPKAFCNTSAIYVLDLLAIYSLSWILAALI